MQIDQFLSRWRHAGGSERANYQLFIADLCDLLEVDKPQPAVDDTRESTASALANVSAANVKPHSGQSHNPYVFERRVVFHHGDGSTSNGFIDCYKRGSFISKGTRKNCLPQLLETLVALGRARQSDDGRFGASR